MMEDFLDNHANLTIIALRPKVRAFVNYHETTLMNVFQWSADRLLYFVFQCWIVLVGILFCTPMIFGAMLLARYTHRMAIILYLIAGALCGMGVNIAARGYPCKNAAVASGILSAIGITIGIVSQVSPDSLIPTPGEGSLFIFPQLDKEFWSDVGLYSSFGLAATTFTAYWVAADED